jgi:hypothetical protein
MNNTKKQPNKQHQKNQQQKTRQSQGSKKQGRHPNVLQEHEYPEMRLTR